METTDAIFQWPLSILMATALFAIAGAALQAGCSQKNLPWTDSSGAPEVEFGVTHRSTGTPAGIPGPAVPAGSQPGALSASSPARGDWGTPGMVAGGTGLV